MSGYVTTKLNCCGCLLDIMGELYLPEGAENSLPIVIMSHGFNGAGADISDMASHLAKNGIAAYIFDFPCGSSRSNGSTLDMSIEAQKNDLHAVIDMIEGLECVDKGRIFLYGESQGGFVSALTAAERPERIAGMFLVYPAFCIPNDWLKCDPRELPESIEFMGLEISKKFYYSVPRYDVYEHVKSFANPVSIYHGDCDTVVDISYSHRLAKTLPHASLTVIGGRGHGFPPKARENIANDICRKIQNKI